MSISVNVFVKSDQFMCPKFINKVEVRTKRDIVSNVMMNLLAKSVDGRGLVKKLKYMDDPQLKQLSGNNLQSIARQ